MITISTELQETVKMLAQEADLNRLSKHLRTLETKVTEGPVLRLAWALGKTLTLHPNAAYDPRFTHACIIFERCFKFLFPVPVNGMGAALEIALKVRNEQMIKVMVG